MCQTFVIDNKWLTHPASFLGDYSPNVLEGTFIQHTVTQVPFTLFPLCVDSLSTVSESFRFSNSTELNGRHPGLQIMTGQVAGVIQQQRGLKCFVIRGTLNWRHQKRKTATSFVPKLPLELELIPQPRRNHAAPLAIWVNPPMATWTLLRLN